MDDQKKRECLLDLARSMAGDCKSPDADPAMIISRYRNELEKLRQQWRGMAAVEKARGDRSWISGHGAQV